MTGPARDWTRPEPQVIGSTKRVSMSDAELLTASAVSLAAFTKASCHVRRRCRSSGRFGASFAVMTRTGSGPDEEKESPLAVRDMNIRVFYSRLRSGSQPGKKPIKPTRKSNRFSSRNPSPTTRGTVRAGITQIERSTNAASGAPTAVPEVHRQFAMRATLRQK